MDDNNIPMPEEEQLGNNGEELIDLRDVEPMPDEAPSLPAVIGFTEKHEVLNHELIERVRGLLSQQCTVESYAISDYYGNQVREAITVLVGKIRISIDLITPR